MDSKDLMIRDWVYQEGNDNPVQIDAVFKFGNVLIKGYILEASELNPIPITKNILENNGFIYHDINGEDNGYRLDNILIDDEFYIWIGDGIFKLQYVHQLQHILNVLGYTNFKV